MQPSGTSNQVGQAAADTTGGVEGAVRDVTNATDRAGRYDPFALELDPLGPFVGGRLSFSDVGIAADAGVHEIFWNHLVVGGGVGLEYLSVSHDFGVLPTGPSTIA